MKHVLIVAHHFPPSSAVGGVRPAKFAKFLPKSGWAPTVLTVKAGYHSGIDLSQPGDAAMPFPIIRTGFVRNPSHYYRRLKRALGFEGTGRASNPPPPGDAGRGANEASTLGEWVNAVLSFPDEDAGWVPFAVWRGHQLARRNAFDCVLTSGPPHSTHLIGAWLSRSTGRPWVADFRDPLFLEAKRNRISRRLDARLEAFIMRRASLVLTTTQRFADELARRHPAHAGKIRTIPNGFDPDDFAGVPRRKADKFTIAYLGTLYVGRDPEPVLRAVARLIGDGVISRDRIALRFAGACENAAGKPMRELIARYGLESLIELPGWVPRQQAFELMAQAHVVLLLAENQGLMIPAKIYDYFGIGSDILALTEEGATADLLRETGRAAVHRPDDEQGIARSIEGFYRTYLGGVDHGPGAAAPDGLSKYSRARLAQELADLLDALSRSAEAG